MTQQHDTKFQLQGQNAQLIQNALTTLHASKKGVKILVPSSLVEPMLSAGQDTIEQHARVFGDMRETHTLFVLSVRQNT